MLIDHQVKGLPRQGRFSDKIEQLAEQIYFKYMRVWGKAPLPTSPEETAGELRGLKESLEIGFFRSVGLSSEEIWGFYIELNEVEAAFRCLKTDLGTRPIHPQNDTRVEAHLFYSVLAYSILKSILKKLVDQDINMSGTHLKQILSTHIRATIMYTDPEGYRIHIRQTGQPEDAAKKLFSLLKVKVSKNQIISKVKV